MSNADGIESSCTATHLAGFPDEWAHAGALRDVQAAQQGVGRRLADAARDVGARPVAVDWFLGGAPVEIRDAATLTYVLDDVLSVLEAGADPSAVLGALEELGALGAVHVWLDSAKNHALVELAEVVNGHEASCGRRAWHWEMERREPLLLLHARWERGEPPAWWACAVTRLVVDDGRLIDDYLRPWGTLWVVPEAAARTLADAELWLVEMSSEADRSAQS